MDENKELLKAFERRLQIADSLANLGCAWAVVSLLGRDGFWFQRLLFSVTPDDDRLLLACQVIAACVAALVVERYRGWPLFHSLPRAVGAAACVFAVTVCVAAGVLAYGIAMYAPMGYPAAWDGFLWW